MFYISHMPMQTYNKKKKGGGNRTNLEILIYAEIIGDSWWMDFFPYFYSRSISFIP